MTGEYPFSRPLGLTATGDEDTRAFRETVSKGTSAVNVAFIIVPIVAILIAILAGWAMWKRPDLLWRPYGPYGPYGRPY